MMFMKESCTYSSIMYEYVVFIPWYEAVWDLLFAIPVKNDKDTYFSIMVLERFIFSYEEVRRIFPSLRGRGSYSVKNIRVYSPVMKEWSMNYVDIADKNKGTYFLVLKQWIICTLPPVEKQLSANYRVIKSCGSVYICILC
jgi:hypothetical protein